MEVPVLELAQALLKCPSVTPADEGALTYLADVLAGLGFEIWHLPFGPEGAQTPNLFARRGRTGPHLCFAGHTDVVPPGEGWRHPPFAAMIEENVLYGRGASDMKGAIAAFTSAVSTILQTRELHGSISFLITGDEEGTAQHGTRDVLGWMKAEGHIPDFCLVGEPSNPEKMGEIIKIGRRGSLNATVTIRGVQGHVAYPLRADNPIHRLIALVNGLRSRTLDDGNAWFQPSSLQITNIDVGNEATNIIPGQASLRLNIRFNNHHLGADLAQWIKETTREYAPDATVDVAISGEAFLTEPNHYVESLARSIEAVTGQRPQMDTSGGTSDARFIAPYCPTAEFGLVGATMHKVDEAVHLGDLDALRDIYRTFIMDLGL
ncbi:succinyl-diaminopimelate desuccinylase [Candidatus Kirkpatrickella diaphorinae]|uniref:Succinyl-diaminopimelate desuccinylase n=1 Tax=Candidatus Kirkpatrickella diaphorinae TaxID=2984322 RepID=A0ABY6GMT1_9PROT|nr:succinyl-diaminopimelate desuccinylase [Candidatus Kirkpatrickella diaphorinae]UYH52183.1 succinyl-diaminopimelate desuccinylase [Candidatus Kirkpatrickella diaphorinae]